MEYGIETEANAEVRAATATTEATALIVVKDIQYPFSYPIGIGTPYLQGKWLKPIRKKVVLKEGEVVAIVGRNFALIPNELVEEMVEKAIIGYGLTKLRVMRGRYGHSIRIDLLTERQKEVKVGDIVQYGVSVRNSIDGTSSLAVDLLSYRLACRNGAVMRSKDMTFATRHIGNPRELLEAFHKALAETLEQFEYLHSLYKKMTETYLEKEGAKRLLALRLPEKYYRYTPIAEDGEVTREATLWEVFNGITYVLTHQSRASPLARSYISHRLHRVMQSLTSASA